MKRLARIAGAVMSIVAALLIFVALYFMLLLFWSAGAVM